MSKLVPTALFACGLACLGLLASCTPGSDASDPVAAEASNAAAVDAASVAAGTVTGISDNHGNVYTSISPERYEELGLRPGGTVRVAFDEGAPMTLPIGSTYTDVPTGQPLAVLHREGLTFAVRDGNFSEAHGVGVGEAFEILAVEGQ